MKTEEKKKIIIRDLLNKGNYTKAIMYDDAEPNLQSFVELKKEYPRTKFYAWHVSLEGQATEYHRTNENFAESEDPINDLLQQKGLVSGPSQVDQDKLDQIIQRLTSQEQPAAVAPVAQATPTVTKVSGQSAMPKTVATPKPVAKKVYTPVTSSPFEISLRKAAIGAKIVGTELAAFLAQCAHESAKFTTTKEFSNGSQYEGRADLGNVKPGDGPRYKGRGFIQITGRANYTQASKDLGIDLVNHPELAEKPDVAAKVSLWYWKTRVQPKISNFTNTKQVTKKVNGGLNGLQQRTNLTKSFQVANK